MRTFEFDNEGDWTLDMTEGADELRQAIEHNLYTRLGEWFLNETVGMSRDYFEEKPLNQKRIVAELTRAILYEERVSEVRDIQLDFDRQKRTLGVEFTALTKEGVINGEINRRFWL